MFSENWNLEQFAYDAKSIIDNLEQLGVAQYYNSDAGTLITSSNLQQSQHAVVIASGYPERSGIWSYTLWELYKNTSERKHASMSSYLIEISKYCAWIILDPHFDLQKSPDESINSYFKQFESAYLLLQQYQILGTILGFSLGCDAVLQFLQNNPNYCEQTKHLILLDPSPPSLGRRKLTQHLDMLVANATCFGMCDSQGNLSEFAEIVKMRLKLNPTLIECQQHGEIPSLALPYLLKLNLF